jgi:hypothetical protein
MGMVVDGVYTTYELDVGVRQDSAVGRLYDDLISDYDPAGPLGGKASST